MARRTGEREQNCEQLPRIKSKWSGFYLRLFHGFEGLARMCLLQVPKLDPVVNVGVVAGHQEGLSARRDVQLSGLVLRMSGGNSEVVALVFAPREPISGRFGEKYVPIENSIELSMFCCEIDCKPSKLPAWTKL